MPKSQQYIIVKDRVEVYRDFALNLLYYINDYYLDRNTLSSDEDIWNHYCFCYRKVCDEFKQENLDFTKNKEVKDYFFKYYYHEFYVANDSQDTSLSYFEKFWKGIFEIDKQKNKNLINILIDIYHKFDKSVNQEKNILEIV